MLVQVNDAVAVGPTNDVRRDPGDRRQRRQRRPCGPRAAASSPPSDFNPERIVLNDDPWSHAARERRRSYPGAGRRHRLQLRQLQAGGHLASDAVTGGSRPRPRARPDRQLSVATFNVENLAPTDPAAQVRPPGRADREQPAVAGHPRHRGDPGQQRRDRRRRGRRHVTFKTLIAAITAAGGPTYQFRQIDPVNDQDGGEPGGNIRVVFLFRTDRGLTFVDRPGGPRRPPLGRRQRGRHAALLQAGAHRPDQPGVHDQPQAAGGRVPLPRPPPVRHRQPLQLQGRRRAAVRALPAADAELGGPAPPAGPGGPRLRGHLLAADPNADVVVLGDLNDFEFSEALTTSQGPILIDLIETLPPSERYTYVFEGNSEALDHILLSDALFDAVRSPTTSVHVNAEFADQVSDHDPQVVRITLNDPPTVDAGGLTR